MLPSYRTILVYRYQHWSIANLQYQISNPYLDLLVEIYLLMTYLRIRHVIAN